jgi:DNA-directed RNA polymerase specialized sigma24 family protein
MSGRPTDVDPLVVPFLHAADETCARERLGELLTAHASPVVGPIIQRQLAFGGAARRDHDREDLQSTVLLRLTAQLWALRRGEAASPIVSLSAYAATAAYNACHEWLRRRAPRRASVQSRARYVLTHDPRLTIWEVADRDWCCAALDARDRAIAASEDQVREVAGERLAGIRRAIDGGGDPSTSPRAFAAFIHAILDALQRPCRFVTLVTVLADCLGEVDVVSSDEAERGESPRSAIEGLPDPSPTAADALAHRSALVRVWVEIRALPLRQRVALLVNLRDDEGRGTIELWPQTGIASMAELAEALDITKAQFLELWPTLPRDDQWIASQLGVTRRQVINLRKCARERLARRLRDVFMPAGGGR